VRWAALYQLDSDEFPEGGLDRAEYMEKKFGKGPAGLPIGFTTKPDLGLGAEIGVSLRLRQDSSARRTRLTPIVSFAGPGASPGVQGGKSLIAYSRPIFVEGRDIGDPQGAG